jgi:hypothetical protein
MGKIIAAVVGLVTLLTMLWGGIAAFDTRYAKAADQKATDQLLHDKVDSDHLRLLRERKWQMEKEFPVSAGRPESVDKTIKNYEIQEKALDQKLQGRIVE